MPQSTRPPTLDELVKILRIATHFRMVQSDGVDHISISFQVSKKDCDREEVHFWSTGSDFLKAMTDELEKLQFFLDLEKGATADDCITFLNNELKHTPPGGLDGTIRRRFYTTTIRKLKELRDWRYYMDSKRFEELRRQENERKARERQRQEEYRKAEEARKAQEEQTRRANQAREEQEKRWDKERAESYRRQFKEEMNNAFEDAMFYGSGAFRTGNQRSKGSRFEDYFKTDTKWEIKKWYEILGIPASADKATIKSAWRKLAKQYHPDRNKDPKAGFIMAQINKAKDDGLAGLP
jgi:hypothetical protein